MASNIGIPPEFVQMLSPMMDAQVFQMCGFHLTDLNTEEAAK
jgi:hypothetical protein